MTIVISVFCYAHFQPIFAPLDFVETKRVFLIIRQRLFLVLL